MDLRDWQYHESNIPKKDTVEGVQYREKKKQEFIDEIKTNWDKYSDFFNEYNENSFDSFIDQYANHKITLIDLADYWVSQTKESKEMQYQEEVNESFDLIL